VGNYLKTGQPKLFDEGHSLWVLLDLQEIGCVLGEQRNNEKAVARNIFAC
jgi:hypothetical protein